MDNQAPGKRQINKIQFREAILKASRRLFSSAGYEAVKMEDIAAKAKVSRATLYNYFPSKESLLTGTLDAVHTQVAGEADAARQADTPPEQILFDTFHTLVNFTMKYPALTRRISYLNTLSDSSLYHCLQPIYDLIIELIEAAIAEGTYREGTAPEAIFEIMLGMYYVILNHWDYCYPEDDEVICGRLRNLYDVNLKPYRPE
jgi:AcrR family transcriptional regulator